VSLTTPSVAVTVRLVRVLAPKWASKPESGDGAAHNGGRFNAKGQPALYLSFDLVVAAHEYTQDLPTRPGTFCQYDVSLRPVADLTSDATLATLGLTRGELLASWKDELSRGTRPSTWAIADKLVALGYVAALYESAVPQNRPPNRSTPGVNVVVWNWSRTTPDQQVVALDPTDDLPRDQSSWPVP
jgi:RES domain-containing protein